MNQNLIYQGNQNLTIELKQGTSLTVRQINSVFQSGLWRFESQNKLTFQPITSLFQRLFPLTATYTEFETVYKFRAEQILEFERVFLDGIIQIEDESLILDSIYSLSTPSEPLQIARIIQKLEPTSLSINEFEQYSELATNSSTESEESLAIKNAEQFKLDIKPIQVIKNYSVVLKASTESVTFDPLEAILYITYPSESERPNNIQLATKNILESQHGNFHWVCQPMEQDLNNDWYSLEKIHEDGFDLIRINLNYQETIPTINCIWYVNTGNDLKSNILPVTGENITVNLTIDGDLVTGNISASGQYIDSQNHSAYQATIVGEIEKSRQVEELRQTLNSKNANLTGCWLTKISTIGKIKLQQHGNEVQGTYHPDNEYSEGQIRGNVEGNFVELNWTDGKQKGWGYFRSLNQGGTLSGMWGVGDFPNEPQAVVANWQLAIDIEAASQEDEIFLRELRWLGHELIIQQRFEQGITVLEEILRLYRDRRHHLSLSLGEEFDYLTSQEELGYLHNEAFTLVGFVLRCNVYLGNYHQLISNLDHLTEIVQLLSAEESAGRLFRERTASIRQNAIVVLRRFQMFVSGLESIKHLLENESERGVIGIYSNCESGAGNVVERVTKDSPAEVAGILAGDILVRVGEAEVRDISRRECYDLLTGEPNTLVNILVKRKDEEITFNIPRKSCKIYPVHRQLEFTALIEHLEKYHVALSDLAETKLNRIEELNFDLVRGKIDFIEAWTILRNNLVVLGETINFKLEELLELKETLFIEYPDFLEDVNSAINITINLRENIINRNKFNNTDTESDARQIIEFDSKIENFFINNPHLSQIETILFHCYLHSFQVANNFYTEINLERNFMSQIDIVKNYAENQKTCRTMLSNLTSYVERWRSKLVEDLEKIEALEQAQPLFTKVVEMSVALEDVNEALIFSEKSRARAFADLLATRFNQNISQSSFSVTSPEITLEQIQQLARTNSATIVEYFIVEEAEAKVYIWVVQPNGSTILKTVELNSDLKQSKHFISDLIIKTRESFGIRHFETFSDSLNSSFSNARNLLEIDVLAELENSRTLLIELYQLLIEPIESYLDSSSTKKVIIVPHENLFLLPFATLLNPKTNQYLIEQYSVILSPSIQTLDLTQQNFISNSEAQNILVVGNPKMPSFGEPPQPLPQLPYAETAAKAISNLFQTKSLVGKQATKQEVLSQLPKARIIHFGTHGEFNDAQPLQSGIALAPEGEEKGFLSVEDILARFAPPQTTSLNAELVVLSACSTGLGKITGDGVIGLARGLMAAGVKAVLVSLWEVQDFPTACLMVQFYKYLQAKNTPNEALKKAQVWLKNLTNQELSSWMRQEKLPFNSIEKQRVINWLARQQKQGNLYPFQHPYYWGAFYLIGA